MTPAQREPHDTAVVRDIEEELSELRAALEDAVAGADAVGTAAVRENLVIALASFGSPEFDLEARFHVSRLEGCVELSEPGAIAALLVGGDVWTALDKLACADDASAADDPRLLRLAFSAILRMGTSCPELPWLTALVGRLPVLAERGTAAAQLMRFLPPGGPTRADMAHTAADCVASLWLESPEWARSLLDVTCRSLIDANDQPLLATTASALMRSLPAGNPAERNTLGYLLITSLLNSGDITGTTTAMQSLLDTLRAETWDHGNFDLLTSVASVAAEAATTSLANGDTGVATKAVAVADQAFGLVERIDAPDVTEMETEHRDIENRLSVAFSRVAAAARSLTQEVSLEIATPEPPPFYRFRPGETGAGAMAISPARSARISEARFLEECARVGWKAIPTPLEVDFGLDYRVEIPDTPDRTSTDVEFLVQLKSTSAAPNASGFLTVSIDETTLKYWSAKVLPTLVVLFHHPADRFYTSWYLPALDDAPQRTFRFAREDEWDPITLRTDVQRYYRHMRVALASGGDWSVLAIMQFHCALLIKLLLQDADVRRAALDPDADLSGAKTEHTFLTLLLMHHRALSSPAPILSDQPNAADIVKLLRTLDAIVRSWTLAGPQKISDVRIALVATHRVFKTARDLLHVAVELDCALASAIVEAQETRSAALSRAAAGSE